jgi:hypothetical protein
MILVGRTAQTAKIGEGGYQGRRPGRVGEVHLPVEGDERTGLLEARHPIGQRVPAKCGHGALADAPLARMPSTQAAKSRSIRRLPGLTPDAMFRSRESAAAAACER